MSSLFRCQTCLGTYRDVLSDGTAYYHACPPVSVPGAQPDSTLPGFTPPGFAERANKRDETLPPGIVVEEGIAVRLEQDPHDRNVVHRVTLTSRVKSEGQGRTPVAP